MESLGEQLPSAIDDAGDDAGNEHVPVLELTKESVMQLAKNWYNNEGPYRAMYSMQPRTAFENNDHQWSVKFQVAPDTGFLYFRKFTFTKAVDGQGWMVSDWSEDPERPDGEYTPEEDIDLDDDETLEEEERIAAATRESDPNEIDMLKQESEMSVEELMAKYGYTVPGNTADSGGEAQPVTGKRKRKKNDTKKYKKLKKKKRLKRSAEHSNSDGVKEGSILTASKPADIEPKQPAASDEPEELKSTSTRNSPRPAPLKSADNSSDSDSSDSDYVMPETVSRSSSETGADLFSRALSNGNEADVYVGVAENAVKESRVGEKYQAMTPDIGKDPVDSRFGSCVWSPPGDLAKQEKLKEYQSLAVAAIATQQTPMDDTLFAALHLLFKNNFDYDISLQQLAQNPPQAKLWTPEDTGLFEEGLQIYGKNFFNIHVNKLPHKTVKAIVDFYHYWKKSVAYEQFVKAGKGYKGVPRPKHFFEPGNDVEKFAVFLRSLDEDSDFGHHSDESSSGGSSSNGNSSSDNDDEEEEEDKDEDDNKDTKEAEDKAKSDDQMKL